MDKLNIKFFITLIFIALFLLGCGKDENKKSEITKTTAENSTEEIVKTDTGKEQKKKAQEIKVTFVELGSVKCIPCKMMKPIIEEIKKEYSGQVKVIFYDVWTPGGKPYIKKYRIRAIPTQVFLDKDGNEYYRHTGFFSKDELIKVLKIKGVK